MTTHVLDLTMIPTLRPKLGSEVPSGRKDGYCLDSIMIPVRISQNDTLVVTSPVDPLLSPRCVYSDVRFRPRRSQRSRRRRTCGTTEAARQPALKTESSKDTREMVRWLMAMKLKVPIRQTPSG